MLRDTAYGKSRVRLVQLTRRTDRHELCDLTLAIRFQGAYDASYTDGITKAFIIVPAASHVARHLVERAGFRYEHSCVREFAGV